MPTVVSAPAGIRALRAAMTPHSPRSATDPSSPAISPPPPTAHVFPTAKPSQAVNGLIKAPGERILHEIQIPRDHGHSQRSGTAAANDRAFERADARAPQNT